MTEVARLALAGGAAVLAGAANAIAGGGTLITFPALVALGLPAVVASATNTVALCPGYLGATLAQRAALAGQRGRLGRLVPVAALGGAGGALLLLHSGEAAFTRVVPYLILTAAALLAGQGPLRRWLGAPADHARAEGWAIAPIGLAAVYGGYFGAGLGVIVLAALGVALGEPLPKLNATKQAVSLAVNVAAALVLAGSSAVDWPIAGAMFAGALAGGALGGVVAARVPAGALRWTVVALAIVVAARYLAR